MIGCECCSRAEFLATEVKVWNKQWNNEAVEETHRQLKFIYG